MLETKNHLRTRIKNLEKVLREEINKAVKREETIKALKYDNQRLQELDIKKTKEYAEISNKHDRLVKDVIYYKERAEKLHNKISRIDDIINEK